jgi:nudix-type nucleoside diphosphatase (YffH/AdpP family)
LFFYGTLRHMPLLRLVLGRSDADLVQATLSDHAVYWAKDQAFPMIVAETGSTAKGVLARGLSEEDVARLNYYEGGFAYDLAIMEVATDMGSEKAEVFFPQAGIWEKGEPWSLADWQIRWGGITMGAAEDVMARYGHQSAAEIQRLFPYLRARAWAGELAADTAPQTLRRTPEAGDFAIVKDRPGFDGFFRMRAFDLQYKRFDGSLSGDVPRECLWAFDAALVLPYDPITDQVLLIEQLRFGPVVRGDKAPWVLEPIAGLVDAGEDPADTARREAMEEAGIALTDLRPMTKVYGSPGYSTEFFHCYLAVCDLSKVQGGQGGLPSENEDIRSHVVSFDAAMGLVDSGEVNAGPLAMMLLWLARARESLRSTS